MHKKQRGIAMLAIAICIAIAALATGFVAKKALDDRKIGNSSDTLQETGRQIGGIIGGPAGESIGGTLGYILALGLGLTAAQRHGAATAANATLKALSPTKSS
jgi:hypothetical protein